MFKKIFNFTFFVFFSIVGLTYVIKTNPYSELISHFAFILSLISAIYFLFYLYFRNKLFIILSIFACVLTAYPWLSLLNPIGTSNQREASDDISIMQLNIYYKNNDVYKFENYLKEIGFPEILVIQEATQEIVDKLESLKTEYPYTFEAPERGAYGMVLFSKIPIVKIQRISFDKTVNKYTLVEFETLQRKIPFALIELHASSPSGDDQMNERKQELEEIATIIAQLPNEHKILIGDLNTTPYSPYFHKLRKNSGLKNAMQGLRIQGTWPSNFPFFLRIPLDHLLVSNKICVIKQAICPDLGSDHMPILSHIRLPR
jgi:endonuclease/exonuclease/phosphatase (EEP) superfamily protein YafD